MSGIRPVSQLALNTHLLSVRLSFASPATFSAGLKRSPVKVALALACYEINF
jgi:hypothetical protein